MARKTQRRNEQGEESRLRILEATVALAAERGYDGTSVALVTEATGLPASSLYWHFKNKDELLAGALEYSYRHWRRSAPAWSSEVDDEGGDLEARIHRRLHAAAAAITESPEFWRLGLMLALEKRPVEPAARRRFLEVREETRNGIAQWWRQILAPGSGDDDTVMRLARFHLSVMDGLYIGMRADRGWDRDKLVDLVASGLHAHALRTMHETSADAAAGADRNHGPEPSRERILAAAAEIAAESGYEGTTIAKVTKRSGLPASSVYWFFKDKDELLAEVVRHSFERWSAGQPMLWRPPESASFLDGLTVILQKSVHGLAAAPDFLRIGHMLTLQNRSTESAARTRFLQIRDGVEQRISTWFRLNLPAEIGHHRPDLPRELAQVVLAANEGLFLAQQIDAYWDADEVVTVIVDIVRAAISGGDVRE